jgi:hypothetical protein
MSTYLSPINLAQNELQNAVLQNLTTSPAAPKEGQLYFNTTFHTPYIFNGNAWLTFLNAEFMGAPMGLATLDALGTLTASQRPIASATVLGCVKDGTGVTTVADGTISVDYGNTSGTAVQGNDTRVVADQAAGTASIRTIGTGALQAAAGNHVHPYLPLSGGTLTGAVVLSGDPTLPLHPASKQYVDNMAAGLDVKASVRAATVGTITLSGIQTIDGVALVAGNRVLVKDQTAAATNGIYVVATTAWTRSTDADNASEVTPGAYTYVEEGGQQRTGWVLITTGTITLGTTALTFTQWNGAGATVEWDDVVNKPVFVNKFAANIGNGTATSFVVGHALNTMDVSVSLRLASSTMDYVFADVQVIDANSVRLLFSMAPTTNQYRVVVIG